MTESSELERVWQRLDELDERMERMADVTQAQIDAITAELSDAAGAIQSEIANLESQISTGTPASSLDLSGLKDAADALAGIPQAVASSGSGGTSVPSAGGTSTDPSASGTGAPSDPAAPVDGGSTGPLPPVDPAAPAGGGTAPVDTGTGTGTTDGGPTTSGTTTPVDSPVQAPDQAVYTFQGDGSTIDASQWVNTGLLSETGQALYTYAGDTAPGDTNGNGLDGGLWVLYTGQVVPASNPAANPDPAAGGAASPATTGPADVTPGANPGNLG